MSDAAGEEIRFLLERARVVGRIADHVAPVRPAEPARVVVQADSPAFAADFAADIAGAARLRGRQLLVDVGRAGDRVATGTDEVVLLTSPGDASGEQEATIVVSFDAQGRPALERLGMPQTSVHLFSYGTLQQEEVQRSNFGRLLHGSPDLLVAHRSDWVQITDPNVIAASGTARHPIVRPTGDPSDSVAGTLFVITPAELAAADTYEVDDYRRFQVRLNSGTQAWVYLAAEFAASVAE
jgi:gamma-glutamylcyclotransferase (GGCT)/AIG2-like uncharacterized protein YtfP